ncbi:MAG: acylphosphatase [Bacteroidota bacterium]
MPKQFIAIQVFGKVQGVWFRASTQKKALALNICGTVQNNPDGSVYIEASGTPAAIADLLDWCQTGPPHARVDRLVQKPIGKKEFTTFEILR